MQLDPIELDRPNIADILVKTVRRMIVDGDLPAGGRINEVHLAERLGVSRTPLREALATLSSEGALTQQPRKGYFVRALSKEELVQIYPIRQLLDPEALRLTGIPSRECLDRLEELNAEIVRSEDPDEIHHLNDAWYTKLYEDCPNREIVKLIRQFYRRTSRYEILLMKDRKNAKQSFESKRKLIAALKKGNLDRACDLVREIMTFGTSPIIEAIENRTK